MAQNGLDSRDLHPIRGSPHEQLSAGPVIPQLSQPIPFVERHDASWQAVTSRQRFCTERRKKQAIKGGEKHDCFCFYFSIF